MGQDEQYENPLVARYASAEMSAVFSNKKKFTTWRKLWIALAESEQALGLPITDAQLDELRQFQDDVNYDVAQQREREVRHDVMAHVYAYGQQCPNAQPIIHLGATSAYVQDNTELIQIVDALEIVRAKLVSTMADLKVFALEYRELPTLGFTHFQPAQLTTVGKRAALWLQDVMIDFNDLEHHLSSMRFRGVKGTTGTQASFLELFEGDSDKVQALDQMVSEKMGFMARFAVTGQTYSRKIDSQIGDLLSRIAQTAHKFGNDLRLLQNLKEVEEPFEKEQIGSSAMAYKRNPMRSERICALARFVMTTAQSPAFTAATQWFERTLDDSANKRLALPQMFLGIDAILILFMNVVRGLVVYPQMIRKHIDLELPFMATENIMMEAVKRGGDRQKLHEQIRVHAMEAGRNVKEEGKDNDLLDRIAADSLFGMKREELDQVLDLQAFIGRAPEQVEQFVAEEVDPVLEANAEILGAEAEVNV
ncbi:MAG: adenylosuccinate lyase [Candidatus Latescibacteria bacterium]|nr:adenylosuccinate lyase [Candidatus Latescibacterota bacterium]